MVCSLEAFWVFWAFVEPQFMVSFGSALISFVWHSIHFQSENSCPFSLLLSFLLLFFSLYPLLYFLIFFWNYWLKVLLSGLILYDFKLLKIFIPLFVLNLTGFIYIIFQSLQFFILSILFLVSNNLSLLIIYASIHIHTHIYSTSKIHGR